MAGQGKDGAAAALAVIALGGLLLYLARVKPGNDDFSRTIIPVDEPTIYNWAEVGGMMYFL